MSGSYSPNNRYRSQMNISSRRSPQKRVYSRSPIRRHGSRSPQRYVHNNTRGDKSNPEPNNCVGIFGLSSRTKEDQLVEIFEKYGKIEKIQLVMDRNTNESRGFCFITYSSIDNASKAIEKATGTEIDGKPIRIDYSLSKKPHDPTPGQYLGNNNNNNFRGKFNDRGRDFGEVRGRRRSASRSPYRDQRNVQRGNRSPPRFARSPPRFARSPPRFARSPPRFARSPPRFARSPPRFARSPQRFARSPLRVGRSPQRFARSPQRFARSPQRYARSPPRFQRNPQRFARSPKYDNGKY